MPSCPPSRAGGARKFLTSRPSKLGHASLSVQPGQLQNGRMESILPFF
jgi:hypothetical protein